MRRVSLVASDLDGTLLDRDTFDFAPARPALEALRSAGVPLVVATAKTRAEMAALAPTLGAAAAILENGGAVAAEASAFTGPPQGLAPWRLEGGRWRLALGVPRARLLDELPGLAREAGVTARPFAAMAEREVAALTGLPPPEARLAARREHDEPFVLVDGEHGGDDLVRLDHAARRRGLRVTHGGRLFHLAGPSDKGAALRALLDAWPDGGGGAVLGLGDAVNDLSLLLAVDRPVVVPRKDGSLDALLAARLPGRERAPGSGPAGWAAAVFHVLAGRTLPRVPA